MEAAHSSETLHSVQIQNTITWMPALLDISEHKEETLQSLGNSVHKIWWTESPAVLAEGSETHKHNLKYH